MRSLFRRNKDKDRSKGHAWATGAEKQSGGGFYSPPGKPPLPPPTFASARLATHLPTNVLERIFALVCPHARDESYEPCEGSSTEGGCMLCDVRDLAHCVQVCRAWRPSAIRVLYHSVRIEPVHYCELEGLLAERRKKRSRFDKNGIPEDPAPARLRLLRRTVRDDPTRIGKLVQFFKMPYMVRESCHVEVAQTIAVLPNLHYVDLPEGMFSDEPRFATLRLEVQARCPQIRKMTYNKGSERSFTMLATGQIWTQLEVLELNGLAVDPVTMRGVLSCLGNLRALKVTETDSFSDEVLAAADGLPPLPPLEELVLKDTPKVTTQGVVQYLAWHETQTALKVLTIKDTGVRPSSLQEILTMATSLKTLALQTRVTEHFPTATGVRPLSSRSLETLRYEISPESGAAPYANITAGYYSYLATSILSDGLPNLRRLYVHDDTFPDQLHGLPSPGAAAPFAGGGGAYARPSSSSSGRPFQLSAAPPGKNSAFLSPPQRRPVSNIPPTNRFSSNNPFAGRVPPSPSPPYMLEIFTKSDEQGKWNFARVGTARATATATMMPMPGMPPSPTPQRRPVSSYGLAADVAGPGWDQGAARRSVMIGSGMGGFLEVPVHVAGDVGAGGGELSESWRPRTSDGSSRGDKDLWR